MAALPKTELRAVFAALSGLPTSHVIWQGEALPFPGTDKALLTLDLIALRPLGFDDETVEYPTPSTTKKTLKGQRVMTISARIDSYGTQDARDMLEDVRLGIAEESTREDLNDAGLAFTEATDIRPVPFTADNRAVSSASEDFFFNQVVVKVITKNEAGYIEHVEMTGLPEVQAAGTFKVSRPMNATLTATLGNVTLAGTGTVGP